MAVVVVRCESRRMFSSCIGLLLILFDRANFGIPNGPPSLWARGGRCFSIAIPDRLPGAPLFGNGYSSSIASPDRLSGLPSLWVGSRCSFSIAVPDRLPGRPLLWLGSRCSDGGRDWQSRTVNSDRQDDEGDEGGYLHDFELG